MPRSFLVKRGGLHHIRPQTRSPSPGSTAVIFSHLEKKAGSLDTSLEYSPTEALDNKPVSVTILQQDLPSSTLCNGSGSIKTPSPKSYGGLLVVSCLYRQCFAFVIFLQYCDISYNYSNTWYHKKHICVYQFKLWGAHLYLFSDFRPARTLRTCSPVPSNTFCPLEKVNSHPLTPVVWPRPHVSSGFQDLPQHYHIPRETRSSGAPKPECPLCSKVCSPFNSISPVDKQQLSRIKTIETKPHCSEARGYTLSWVKLALLPGQHSVRRANKTIMKHNQIDKILQKY